MREIITIQLGDFANFIGSHFWNFQDELLGLAEDEHGDPIYRSSSVDMDILYRTGETQGMLVYNPRVISVGFQGSLGSLSSSNASLDGNASLDSSDPITWTGNMAKHVTEPHKRNLFLQRLYEEEHQLKTDSVSDAVDERNLQDRDIVTCLQNDVKFWTDFSKVRFHPRSLYELHGSWMDSKKFDNYGVGKDVFQEGFQKEDLSERLRFFVEECDHIQGIQCFVDDSGGFPGIAADFLEHVADEYTNTPVLLYSTRDPMAYIGAVSRKESISRALHDAVSFSRLSSFAKLIVPVGLPSLTQSKLSSSLLVEDTKAFHCSAVYAASIHTVSIPFRMETIGPTANSMTISGAMDFGEMIHMLAGQARQSMVSVLDLAIPAPSLTGKSSLLSKLHTLTPEIKEDLEDPYAVEALVVQGALHSGVRRASLSEIKDSICVEYESTPNRPMFSHLSASLCPLPLPLPFPTIFASHVGKQGEFLEEPTGGAPSKGSLEIESIPIAARLRSSTAVVPFIENRLGSLRRYGVERGAPGAELLRSWGFGKDEIEDMAEGLAKFLITLDPHPEMSSDSD